MDYRSLRLMGDLGQIMFFVRISLFIWISTVEVSLSIKILFQLFLVERCKHFALVLMQHTITQRNHAIAFISTWF